MLALWTYLTAWMDREDGQAMAEYGLILALIAVVVLVALTLLGTNISNLFQGLAGELA